MLAYQSREMQDQLLPDLTPRQLRWINACRPKGGVWLRIERDLDRLKDGNGFEAHVDAYKIAVNKTNAEIRMDLIDASPQRWRVLVNDFDPHEVSDLANRYPYEAAARILLSRHGDPSKRYG